MTALFAFEAAEIGPDLDLLPLAARRALDHAGLHLSLAGWRSLPIDTRQRLVTLGAHDAVDTKTVTDIIASAEPAPTKVDASADPSADRLPDGLPADRGVDLQRWRTFSPLARFALAHMAKRAVKRNDPTIVDAAIRALTATSAPANRIRREILSLDEVTRAVAHPEAGAIATFIGVVRCTNDGRAVTLLEYEAYGMMAEAELARVLDELQHEMPDVRVAALHRIGSLSVGDVAVLCAASAPHRGEAFTACRELIDRIKARLPIWKREHGPDGPYWVGWEDARCSPDHGEHDHHHDKHHHH